MEEPPRYTRAPGVAEAEVDGQCVLVSPTDLRTFGLNRTSAYLWSQLPGAAGPPISIDELLEAVLERFDVEEERALAEVTSHLEVMVSSGLATPVDPS